MQREDGKCSQKGNVEDSLHRRRFQFLIFGCRKLCLKEYIIVREVDEI